MIPRRLPPYGRQILDARFKGLVPKWGLVVALDDWAAFRGRHRIVIEPGVNPHDLDLTFCAGLDLLIAWNPITTPSSRLNDVIFALLDYLPRRIWVLNRTEPHRSFFAKSVANGIEMPERNFAHEEECAA